MRSFSLNVKIAFTQTFSLLTGKKQEKEDFTWYRWMPYPSVSFFFKFEDGAQVIHYGETLRFLSYHSSWQCSIGYWVVLQSSFLLLLRCLWECLYSAEAFPDSSCMLICPVWDKIIQWILFRLAQRHFALSVEFVQNLILYKAAIICRKASVLEI